LPGGHGSNRDFVAAGNGIDKHDAAIADGDGFLGGQIAQGDGNVVLGRDAVDGRSSRFRFISGYSGCVHGPNHGIGRGSLETGGSLRRAGYGSLPRTGPARYSDKTEVLCALIVR
jgi:hypothetical protein